MTMYIPTAAWHNYNAAGLCVCAVPYAPSITPAFSCAVVEGALCVSPGRTLRGSGSYMRPPLYLLT